MSLQLVRAAAVLVSSTTCCHPPLSPPVLVAAVPPFPRSAFFLAASAKRWLLELLERGAVPSRRRRSPLLSLARRRRYSPPCRRCSRRAAASRPRQQLRSLRRAGRGRGRAPCTPPKGTAIAERDFGLDGRLTNFCVRPERGPEGGRASCAGPPHQPFPPGGWSAGALMTTVFTLH